MKIESFLRSTISEKSYTILFELLLWLNPVKSLIFVTLVHLGLFVLYSIVSRGLLFFLSFFFLFRLWTPIWCNKIWPSIQLPEIARLDDWLTLDPSIPPYEETVALVAQLAEKAFAPLHALMHLRKVDPAKYILYSTSGCLFVVLVGQKVSGFALSYLLVVTFFVTPLLLKNVIFDRLNEQAEEESKISPEPPKEEPTKAPICEQPLVQETNLADLKPDLESESTSGYTESEEESDSGRRESVFDPLAEPTWMEDFGRNISENVSSLAQAISQDLPNVKSQIEEAIGMAPIEKESSGNESSDSDRSGFVLLSTDDAKNK